MTIACAINPLVVAALLAVLAPYAFGQTQGAEIDKRVAVSGSHARFDTCRRLVRGELTQTSGPREAATQGEITYWRTGEGRWLLIAPLKGIGSGGSVVFWTFVCETDESGESWVTQNWDENIY